MSLTFYGRTTEGTPIVLDLGDAAHLNMSNANARAFLLFIGLDPGEHLVGEVTMPEARRAFIRARATFDRRVRSYTRESSDIRLPGMCRVVTGGVDEGYFGRRLDDFERFVDAVVARGATSIYWA